MFSIDYGFDFEVPLVCLPVPCGSFVLGRLNQSQDGSLGETSVGIPSPEISLGSLVEKNASQIRFMNPRCQLNELCFLKRIFIGKSCWDCQS